MADTVVSDAVRFPVDEGFPNIADGNESWDSAGYLMALGQAVDSGSYVRSDSELTFTGHDGTSDQVDVTGGIAYLDLSGITLNVQSGLGGSSPPAYDTALPSLPAIMVALPSTVADLDVQDSTLSQVWLAYATDGTVTGVSAGDVYLRSDDTGSESAPPHPSVELGSANPDDASADTLSNRFGSPEFDSVTAGDGTIGGDPILGGPSSGSSAGLSFGSWTTINANQPVVLILRIFVQTDGTTRGSAQIEVDESGGTSSDYILVVRADENSGSGVFVHDNFTLYLPAGAQIRITNQDDPNNENTIAADRAYVMSS